MASSYEGFARVMLNTQLYIDTMNESIPEAVYKQSSSLPNWMNCKRQCGNPEANERT